MSVNELPPPSDKKNSNGAAVAGLVLSFLIAPLGLIFSIIGLKKAKQLNGHGFGLALAGIIISAIGVVAIVSTGALIAFIALYANSQRTEIDNKTLQDIENIQIQLAEFKDANNGELPTEDNFETEILSKIDLNMYDDLELETSYDSDGEFESIQTTPIKRPLQVSYYNAYPEEGTPFDFRYPDLLEVHIFKGSECGFEINDRKESVARFFTQGDIYPYESNDILPAASDSYAIVHSLFKSSDKIYCKND